MTDAEFHDKVVAFMARIEEILITLPCRNLKGCAVHTDYRKWLVFGLGVGAGIAGGGGAAIKLLGVGG